MEEFKKLSEITNPDVRNTNYAVLDPELREFRSMTLKDIYNSVARIELSASVPEDIRSQFNVAKNLAIYTWFCYPFHQSAEFRAYATLEMALRIRLGHKEEDKVGFRKLLDEALKKDLFKDSEFSGFKRRQQIEDPMKQFIKFLQEEGHKINITPSPPRKTHSELMVEGLPIGRNYLAHGTNALHPGSLGTLETCADMINQLFPATQ